MWQPRDTWSKRENLHSIFTLPHTNPITAHRPTLHPAVTCTHGDAGLVKWNTHQHEKHRQERGGDLFGAEEEQDAAGDLQGDAENEERVRVGPSALQPDGGQPRGELANRVVEVVDVCVV